VKGSDEKKLNRIADNLVFSFQSFKRMSKGDDHHGFRRFDPSRLVLATVLMEGPLPTSEIGRRMDISKPYMTALIDRLIEEGLVERIPDKNDRRIVNVAATKAGRDILNEFKRNIRKIIVENLSSLTSDDISALDVSLKTIRSITSKLNTDDTKKCERG
jgi:MarR family transcriptional regulator, 2-MHQ and catechol-resistance regulon repressor